MIEDDTWYKCTICGREGRVGRCCGDETRIPLNKLAKEEQRNNRFAMNFVKKCKSKTGDELHKTLHAADNTFTFCGKELNEMWYILPSREYSLRDVTCGKCKTILKEVGYEI